MAGAVTGGAVINSSRQSGWWGHRAGPDPKRHPNIAESHPPPRRVGCGRTMDDEYGPRQRGAHSVAAASGMLRMAAELDRYRHAVADEQTGTDLKQIIRDVQRHGIDNRGHHGLETTPKGADRRYFVTRRLPPCQSSSMPDAVGSTPKLAS
jgi:hypothetical protein